MSIRLNLFRQISSRNSRFSRYISSQTAHSNVENTKKTISRQEETHFGFQTVTETEKAQKVYEVFAEVSSSYDRMNDAMSLGIHRIWKDIFVNRLAPTPQANILDVAGGTGDIAFRIANYQRSVYDSVGPLTVCDINAEMLAVGRERASRLGQDHIRWQQGDAEKLEGYVDNTYDAYTIAFGIRNVVHIDEALKEAYRVLKPGGRFLCLEFSHVRNDTLRWLYDQYSFSLIPVMGQLVAGQWRPYQYLVESIRRFPKQEEFTAMLETAGFRLVKHENLSLGIVAIHSAFKL